jgi:hypothetical protein
MNYCPTCYQPMTTFIDADKDDIVYRIAQADLTNLSSVASLMYEAGDVIKLLRRQNESCRENTRSA